MIRHGLSRTILLAALIAGPLVLFGFGIGEASAQGRGGRGLLGGEDAVPPTAQDTATVDLTGYWVSLVNEDWHWRMSVPERGDVASIPFTNDQAARDLLEAWDPERDEAEGNQCKAYGAAAIMRVPTRIRIAWGNPNMLRLETDAGMQTRLFRFGEAAAEPGEPSWQGFSVARWYEPPGAGGRGAFGGGGLGGGRGGFGAGGATPAPLVGGPPGGGRGGRGGPGPGAGGSLEVITTNLRSGYLRKNGVPYSEDARVTEYFHRTEEDYGNTYLIVTTIVEDPEFLTAPFITSSHFKKLPDTDNGWNPAPCSVH